MKKFISNTITIAVLLTLFISCKDTDQELKKEKLNAPEITYTQLSENSAELKWDPVTGAESYSFEQQNGIEITSKKTSLLLNDLVPGINTMRCKSNAGDSDKYEDSDWAEFDIEITKQEKKPLPAPELSYEKTGSFDVRVYWPSVSESVGYAYSLNGSPEEVVYDNEIILEDLDSKYYVLSVKALAGDSEDYSDSPWAEIDFLLESVKLSAPELQYSLDGNKVTFFWEPVPNADNYTLMIDTDFHYTEDSIYEITLPAGEHHVKIKAVSDNFQKYQDSDFSDDVTVMIDYEARYEDYLGSWELIPERMLIYDIFDPESGHTIVDYGAPLTVNIEESALTVEGEPIASYIITGMSQYTYGEYNDIPVPFYATFDRYSNNDWFSIEKGCLEILQGVGIDHAGLPEYPDVKMIFSPAGLGYIDGNESTVTTIKGQYPVITFKMTSPNTAEVKTTDPFLDDGRPFEIIAVESFIMGAYGSGDYEYMVCGAMYDLPAGGYYACPYQARKLDVSLSPAIRDASVMTTSQVLSNISATFKPERNIPQVLSGSPIILSK